LDADPFLRRFERTAVIACVGMATIALIVSRDRAGAAVAVLAGGLLIALSYWTLGAGFNALAAAASDPAKPRRQMPWVIVKVFARYALLALLAYAMIARLRLHPVGLLAGASSVVAAASVEAFRVLLKKS
jgi:ATP synthase I subunit